MSSIFHRTSIRRFVSEVKPSRQELEQILRAAMAAPSAGNQQPWEFYVVTDSVKLAKLAAASPYAGCVSKAPVAIVPCYRKVCRWPEYAQIDMSAAMENMLLQIDELGLGAVWLGIAPLQERMDAVRQVLALPDEVEAFAVVPVGQPAESHGQQDRFAADRIHYVD